MLHQQKQSMTDVQTDGWWTKWSLKYVALCFAGGGGGDKKLNQESKFEKSIMGTVFSVQCIVPFQRHRVKSEKFQNHGTYMTKISKQFIQQNILYISEMTKTKSYSKWSMTL